MILSGSAILVFALCLYVIHRMVVRSRRHPLHACVRCGERLELLSFDHECIECMDQDRPTSRPIRPSNMTVPEIKALMEERPFRVWNPSQATLEELVRRAKSAPSVHDRERIKEALRAAWSAVVNEEKEK